MRFPIASSIFLFALCFSFRGEVFTTYPQAKSTLPFLARRACWGLTGTPPVSTLEEAPRRSISMILTDPDDFRIKNHFFQLRH